MLIFNLILLLFWLSQGKDPLKSLLTGIVPAANPVPKPARRPSQGRRRLLKGSFHYEVRVAALVELAAVPGKSIRDLTIWLSAGICHLAAYLWKEFVISVKAMFAPDRPEPSSNPDRHSGPASA